jgi:DNA-binding cell septation regulator SpoVG
MKNNRRFFHGNGGFFIGMPSRKGPDTEGECKVILRMGGKNDELKKFVLFDRSFNNGRYGKSFDCDL